MEDRAKVATEVEEVVVAAEGKKEEAKEEAETRAEEKEERVEQTQRERAQPMTKALMLRAWLVAVVWKQKDPTQKTKTKMKKEEQEHQPKPCQAIVVIVGFDAEEQPYAPPSQAPGQWTEDMRRGD